MGKSNRNNAPKKALWQQETTASRRLVVSLSILARSRLPIRSCRSFGSRLGVGCGFVHEDGKRFQSNWDDRSRLSSNGAQ